MKLEADGISFRYTKRGRQVLSNVSLSVEEGERVGLTGPSGFGKTTLCRIMAGYERPDSGRVLFGGRELSALRGRLPVQLIGQHPEMSVNPRWQMRQVLEEGGVLKTPLMELLGIEEKWLKRYPSELSGGELQRFCIARALGEETRFLLADEITTMLDTVSQSAIWHGLLEETKRRGIGLVIVSHSRPLLERLCTRQVDLTALNGGR